MKRFLVILMPFSLPLGIVVFGFHAYAVSQMPFLASTPVRIAVGFGA